MPLCKPELNRIIQDLRGFIAHSCVLDPGQGHDLVSESCNDACLMLEQAREELEKKEKEGTAGA